MRRAQAGDALAFRQLVETYKDVSLSLVYGIVKDQALAEDILQDSFLVVYQKLGSFKFKSAFATWLYRIMVNRSYNALKRIKHNKPIEAAEKEQLSSENSSLEKDQQRVFINQALAQLPTDQALVIRLFYLSELSLKEVSQATGFSKSKVKVSLHRGRTKLATALEEIMGDELNELL